MKTKSENLHLYPLFFPYEDPGEIPYDEIAWERDIHPNQLRGMIRAARNNSTIHEALTELGWQDHMIPYWFARPGRRKNRRVARVKVPGTIKETPSIPEPKQQQIVRENVPRIQQPEPVYQLPPQKPRPYSLVPVNDGQVTPFRRYEKVYHDQGEIGVLPFQPNDIITPKPSNKTSYTGFNFRLQEMKRQAVIQKKNENMMCLVLFKQYLENQRLARQEQEEIEIAGLMLETTIDQMRYQNSVREATLQIPKLIIESYLESRKKIDIEGMLEEEKKYYDEKSEKELKALGELSRKIEEQRRDKYQRLGIPDIRKNSIYRLDNAW